MQINEFAKAVHENAKAKGFHDGQQTMASYCANLHGEASELWESYRNGTWDKACDKVNEMEALGLPGLGCAEEELADIIIRALDVMLALGIDPEEALDAKHRFNLTRPHGHGGKVA